MIRRFKMVPLALAATALVAFAAPAQATQNLVISGPSGTYGNDAVTCVGGGTCAFTNIFSFVTPVGYNLTNATITTSALGGNNIDFTSVFLNGNAFTLSPAGVVEFGSLPATAITPGATNTLTVNGQNTGNTAFSGTLTFAAVPSVPEPATWGLMLLGFGAMGISLRRRRRSAPLLAQAV